MTNKTLFKLVYQNTQSGLQNEPVTVNEMLTPENLVEYELPMYLESVSAGFPSPAEDYVEGKLDLNEHLIKNPTATFFVRVTGNSMEGAGIYSGDTLIVDRSINPKNSSVIIAALNGELTVKRLSKKNNKLTLYPENTNYKPIEITMDMEFEVWGVVTTVIHSVL